MFAITQWRSCFQVLALMVSLPHCLRRTEKCILVRVLTSILNSSLKSRTFPSAWKGARVVCLHKSGAISAVTNYRPITILRAASKVFEFVLYSLFFVSADNILIDEKRGFVLGHSTTTNMVAFMTHVTSVAHHHHHR